MSIVDDFIKTTMQAAKQNNWTPGGFGNNLANNAGELAGGLVNLINPLSPTNPVNVAVTHPQNVAPMMTNFVKSIAGSLNNTVGQPVNPQSGKLQIPSLSEAENYTYNKPLDVLSNLAMGAGAVGKVARIGEAGKAASIGEAASPTGWTSEGMQSAGLPPIGSAPGLVSKAQTVAKAGADAGKVSDTAANLYLKPFVARSEVAKDIDATNMAKQMLNDGITGSVNDINSKVQGLLNTTENMKLRALNLTNNPIDLGNVTKMIKDHFVGEPNVEDPTKTVQPLVTELAGNSAKGLSYQQKLLAKLPPQVEEGTAMANPVDAYGSMKNIRNLGYDLVDQGQDVYGRTINNEKVEVGRAYIKIADEMNKKIDNAANSEQVLDQVKTLEDIQALRNISPQFADRIAQNGIGWKDFQAQQKPLVDMAKYVRETQRLANTPGAKFTGQITDAITKGAATGGGFMAGGVPGLVGGHILGQISSPFIQAAVDKFMPKLMTGAASTYNKIQQGGLPSLGGIVKPGLPAMNEMALNQPSQNPQSSPIQTGQKTNASRYAMPEGYQDFSKATTDYTKSQTDLVNKIAQDKADAQTNPLKANQQMALDQGQLDTVNNTWKNQEPIRTAGVNLKKVVGLANIAVPLIQKADISILNSLNGSYDALLNSQDPNNVALGKALQNIQQTTGVDLSHVKSKDALIAGLDQAYAIQKNTYDSVGTSNGNSALPPLPAYTPQKTTIAPIGTPIHYNFNFGSSGEGMPANP